MFAQSKGGKRSENFVSLCTTLNKSASDATPHLRVCSRVVLLRQRRRRRRLPLGLCCRRGLRDDGWYGGDEGEVVARDQVRQARDDRAVARRVVEELEEWHLLSTEAFDVESARCAQGLWPYGRRGRSGRLAQRWPALGAARSTLWRWRRLRGAILAAAWPQPGLRLGYAWAGVALDSGWVQPVA